MLLFVFLLEPLLFVRSMKIPAGQAIHICSGYSCLSSCLRANVPKLFCLNFMAIAVLCSFMGTLFQMTTSSSGNLLLSLENPRIFLPSWCFTIPFSSLGFFSRKDDNGFDTFSFLSLLVSCLSLSNTHITQDDGI